MLRDPNAVYDSREPLLCADGDHVKLNRAIGVTVTAPFIHYGRIPPTKGVEVNYETISVNTRTYAKLFTPVSGDPVVSGYQPEVLAQTRTIIAELTKVIEELTQHRERLNLEIEKHTALGW